MCTWLRKGNLTRDPESLLIAAQDNHIKARIDKTQQNVRCKLHDDRNETINHIIIMLIMCNKLAQKAYKIGTVGWTKWFTRNCKKMKSDPMSKCYMHNPESVLENETPKPLRDFDIQTDHMIFLIRQDIIINKKERTCRTVDFASPADNRERMRIEG